MIKNIITWSFRFLFTGLILLIVLVSFVRFLFAALPVWQPELSRFLSGHFHADLQIESITSQWNGGRPRLSLRGLTLKDHNATETGFIITQLDMELNLGKSLLNWTPVYTFLEVKGVNIDLVQESDSQWTLSGIKKFSLPLSGSTRHPGRTVLEWLSLQDTVDIRNIRLNMRKYNGQNSDIQGVFLQVVTNNSQKELSSRIEIGSGFIDLEGISITENGRVLKWQGMTESTNLDLEKLCALWGGCYDDVLVSLVKLDVMWGYDHGFWNIQGNVNVSDLTYRDNSGELNHLSGQCDLFMQGGFSQHDKPRWQLWLNGLDLKNSLPDGTTYQWENSLYLAADHSSEYSVTVASERIELDLLKRWLLSTNVLPENIANLTRTLNPGGGLNDFIIRLYPLRNPYDFTISTTLDHVAFDAWKGAPSADHVNGQLVMNRLKGYFDLDSENFRWGFPRIFRNTFKYDRAKAHIYWGIEDDFYSLRSDHAELFAPEGHLLGKLRLDIPLAWKKNDTLDMALSIGLKNSNANYAHEYLPAMLPLDSQLLAWLDSAIKKADISEAGFVFNGALVAGKNADTIRREDARWGLFFDIANSQLDYAPQWPSLTELSGQVYINDDRAEVIGKHAKSAGSVVDNIFAISRFSGKSVLEINAHVDADGETLQYFLTQTPINDWMNGKANLWQLEGIVDADLNLTLPLKDLSNTTVSLSSELMSFKFEMIGTGIEVNELFGDLSYNTATGLTATKLSGQLFGNPAEFSIHSQVVNKQPVSTDIEWSSRISVTSLHDWLKLDWLSFLDGETDYRGRVSFGMSENSIEFKANSELQGINVELPAPFRKTKEESIPFDLSLVKKDSDLLNINVSNLGNMKIKMSPEYSLESALLTFGHDSISQASWSDQWQNGNQFLISGVIPDLDIGPWKERFQRQPVKPNEYEFLSRITVDSLNIGLLKYGDYHWSDVIFSFQQHVNNKGLQSDEKGMNLSIDGQEVKGNLWIAEQQLPWSLNMEYVHIPVSDTQESESEYKNRFSKLDQMMQGITLDSLPDIDVQINNLQLDGRDMGRIAFELRQAPHGIKIDNVSGEFVTMLLNGMGDWIEIDNEQYTWCQLGLKGPGIKELQNLFGYFDFVDASESYFNMRLNWNGSPFEGKTATIKGRVDVLLKNGRLRKIDNASSGALKVFGLFNAEALKRRLKLDFSDLYASGISFDKLRTSLNFDYGIITFDTPMVIDGPSSRFKLDGVIDTNNEELDLNLVVTIPMSSNLPILSVILGSNPQVAGIIFLADKLVGKKVDQLANIYYRINGSFDDPKMVVDKLFSKQFESRKNRKKETSNL